MAQANDDEQVDAYNEYAAAGDLQADNDAYDGTGPRIPDFDEDLDEE